MKKILAILLAALLLVSAVPVSAMAAETPTITAEYTAGEAALKKGDKVEVTIKIANNPGFSAATLDLKYDSKVLKFTGLKTQTDDYDDEEIVGLFKKGMCTVNTGNGRVVWAHDSNITKDNTLFCAVFEVVGCGDSTVTVDVKELTDATTTPNTLYADKVTATPSASISVPAVPATSVTLDATAATMYPGDTKNLKTTIAPTNSTDEITWTSSNKSVAIVNNGRITALQAGTATITAKANDTVSATCTVTVKNHVHMQQKSGDGEYTDVVGFASGATQFNYWYGGSKYTMNPTDVYVFDVTTADTVKFGFDDSDFDRTKVAVGYNLDGMSVEALGFNNDAVTSGKEFTIAELLQHGMLVSYEQVSKAFGDNLSKLNKSDSDTLSADDTLVFMCYQDDASWASSQYGILLKINPNSLVPATKVELDKTELTLKLGVDASAQLTATVTPTNTTDKVTWTSDKETVATVDENGKVTPVAAGTAKITATAGSKSASCTVTVKQPIIHTYKTTEGNYLKQLAITGVDAIESASDWVDDGTNVTTTVVLPKGTADGTVITNDFVYYWYDQAYMVKSETKTATLANGTAQVTFKYEPLLQSEKNTRTYVVNYMLKQEVNSVTLDMTSLSLQLDGTQKLTATVDPAALQSSLQWTSSNTSVATVDGSGNVKAVGGGTATITATVMGKSATCAVTVVAPFSATNIPSIGSGDIDVTQILVKTDATITDSAWDGDTLNITLAAGTLDGTKIDAEFYVTLNTTGDYSFNGNDTIDPGAKKVSATIANGKAEIKGAVGLCTMGCGPSDDLSFTPKTYTLKFTVAASAQPDPDPEPEVTKYDVTITSCENGTVTANVDKAAKGDEVRLTIKPADGYTLATLSVLAGEEPVTLNGDCFTMPESAVTVTATFREIPAGYNVTLGDDAEVSVGETVKVEVTVNNSDVDFFNAYDLTLTYDPALLQLTTESSDTMTVTAKDGTARILRYGDNLATGSKVTLNFKALKAGTAAVQLTKALVDISQNANMQNAQTAVVKDGTQMVFIGGYTVTLPDDFTGESGVEPGGNYTFTPKDPYYDYELDVKMGDGTATAEKQGDGYIIKNVTGNLVITVTSKTGKSFDVTLTGLTGEAKATHGTDYVATVNAQTGYTYTIKATMGDNDNYTGFTYDADAQTVTIPGNDIKGNISITATGTLPTPTGYTVTLTGSGAGDATGGSSVAPNETYTFTLDKVSGYTYTVTAQMGEDPVTVTEGEDKKYTIANVTGNLTITIDKAPDVNVEVLDYLTISQGENGKKVFLVRATGSLDGYTYDGSPMYKTTAYAETGHWVYLVITGGTLTADDAKANIAVGTATEEKPLEKTFDVNETGLVDVNDAQLVYDIYNNKYQDFTVVSMKKFLKADTNADGKVDTQDAIAVIGSMNKSTAG